MAFDDFNTIRHYAERNGLEFTYAARLFLALPYEWTRVDRIVSALLTDHVDAYAGEGKVAKPGKEKWTPIQHMKVSQLYIPGLIGNSNGDDLYQQVWDSIEFKYAHNQKPL